MVELGEGRGRRKTRMWRQLGVSLSLVAWAARRDWVPPEGKELALCSPLLSVIGSRLALRGES